MYINSTKITIQSIFQSISKITLAQVPRGKMVVLWPKIAGLMSTHFFTNTVDWQTRKHCSFSTTSTCRPTRIIHAYVHVRTVRTHLTQRPLCATSARPEWIFNWRNAVMSTKNFSLSLIFKAPSYGVNALILIVPLILGKSINKQNRLLQQQKHIKIWWAFLLHPSKEVLWLETKQAMSHPIIHHRM